MGAGDPRSVEDRERLARLAALPEQNPNPVIELDERGLAYANPAALALFPELPENAEDHPLISGVRRVAAGLRETGAGSGAGEVELGGACYHLDVYLLPETGGLRAYATDVTQRRETERELFRSRERLHNIIEHAADALFLHDREGKILEVNRSACESLGYDRDELLSLSVQDIEEGLYPGDLHSLWERMTPGNPVTVDGRHRRKDDGTFPVEVRLVIFEEDRRSLMLALARDVTERQKAQRLLVESERRFRQLFDHCVEAIFLHDTQGRIVDCNAEACLSLGYSREELLSLSVEDFAVDVLSEEERRRRDDTPWNQALRAGPAAQVSFHENVHRRKDGSTFPVEVGIGAMDYGDRHLVLASARDISERKLLEEELVRRATHDPLTGMPNRELLDARLRTALARAEQDGERLAVLLLHLGGLHRAREQLGYRAGDRLLTTAAQRVRGCLGLEDTVGRLSGDELAVLAESANDAAQAVETTLDIIEELRIPLLLADREFQAEVTIGVTLAPGEPGTRDPVDEAYEAMCQARRTGDPYEILS